MSNMRVILVISTDVNETTYYSGNLFKVGVRWYATGGRKDFAVYCNAQIQFLHVLRLKTLIIATLWIKGQK